MLRYFSQVSDIELVFVGHCYAWQYESFLFFLFGIIYPLLIFIHGEPQDSTGSPLRLAPRLSRYEADIRIY